MITFIKNRVQSFYHGICGLKDILTTEHNAWIHFIITIVVFGLSLWLRISLVEFVLVVIVIALVWIAEAFNTVLEIVVDMVSSEYTKVARRAKDIAAGAVLVAAIGAAIVGIFVLGPPLIAKFG